VSIWNKPLTPQEIREGMNLPLIGTEAGLVSYWQFNDASGTIATDHTGTNVGTLTNMDDADWKPSTMPFGAGHSTTQTVSSAGNVIFTGTAVEMDFTSKTGSDEIVVTRIDTLPSSTPDDCQIPFLEQYWIIQQYGSGSFTANLGFTTDENLNAEDEANPSRINLYRRDASGGSEWVRAFSASSVDAASNTVTFEGIDEFGQFLIGRHIDTDPPIAIDIYPGKGGMLLTLSELKIDFNEIVTQVDGKSISLFHANGMPVLTYYIPASNITGSGSTSITINLGNAFEPGSYYVEIDEGAFEDLSLNNFAGYQGSDAWPFTIKSSPSITNDTTWAEDVYVYMDFVIEDSVTLSISPGSNIQFGGHYKIDVKGRLLAIGTKTDSIHFFPSYGMSWNRIVFNQTPASNDTSKISYCILEHGYANGGSIHNDGGAIYIDNVSKLLIEHSRISYSHADNFGGGIYCKDANPIIRNNIISHNWGQIDGGGISMFNSNPSLVNNLIIYNDGNNSGGGMSFYGGSNPHVFNTTFSENHIGNSGGAVSFDRGSSPVFTNCIFYNNHSTYGAKEVDISPVGSNNPDFYYCIMRGGTAGFYGSYHGNYEYSLDTDPLFVKVGDHPFSLLRTSLAVNGGDPATSPSEAGTIDVLGNPRFRHGQIDMGAYENAMAPDDFAGTAIHFDGVDDWIDCGNDTSLNITEAITVEAWIKADTVLHNNSILQKGDIHFLDWDYQLESISGKGIQINLPGPNTGWWEFKYDMEYGEWYHIAWTFTHRGELIAYVNGEIVKREKFPGNIQINTDHLIIASIEDSHSYNGLIDEIRIWNLVRTPQEIRENMYLTFPKNMPGLLSYWQFNTGEGDVLADINGDNRGKLLNMSDDAWVKSTIPFGSGNSNTQIVKSTGSIFFPNTATKFDFVSKTGIDTIVVCKIDTIPNLTPHAGETVFGSQYWEINQYGNGTFMANLNFQFDEKLTVYDELNPSNILLFTRGNTSDSSWRFTDRATSVDAQNNRIFDGFNSSKHLYLQM